MCWGSPCCKVRRSSSSKKLLWRERVRSGFMFRVILRTIPVIRVCFSRRRAAALRRRCGSAPLRWHGGAAGAEPAGGLGATPPPRARRPAPRGAGRATAQGLGVRSPPPSRAALAPGGAACRRRRGRASEWLSREWASEARDRGSERTRRSRGASAGATLVAYDASSVASHRAAGVCRAGCGVGHRRGVERGQLPMDACGPMPPTAAAHVPTVSCAQEAGNA